MKVSHTLHSPSCQLQGCRSSLWGVPATSSLVFGICWVTVPKLRSAPPVQWKQPPYSSCWWQLQLYCQQRGLRRSSVCLASLFSPQSASHCTSTGCLLQIVHAHFFFHWLMTRLKCIKVEKRPGDHTALSQPIAYFKIRSEIACYRQLLQPSCSEWMMFIGGMLYASSKHQRGERGMESLCFSQVIE